MGASATVAYQQLFERSGLIDAPSRRRWDLQFQDFQVLGSGTVVNPTIAQITLSYSHSFSTRFQIEYRRVLLNAADARQIRRHRGGR